ncbi:MAG: GFA family protein [Gammaproteobacteria bacterium]|nr:GFA family protein [Gammaproteobacteria bacterium]
MDIDGRCHCGQIRFRAEIDSEQVEICHCTDCQTLSGSAYRTVVPADANSFEILSGNPRMYAKTAEDGSQRLQAFCPECGSPLYSAPSEGDKGYFGIRVGAINQRNQLIPKKQYWARSAQPWTQDLSEMPKFETE